MKNAETDKNAWKALNKRNTVRLLVWTAGWTATVALSTFGPKFLWPSNAPLTLISILINVGFGYGMILANIAHLKGLDEMQQKIQLNAMGITLGAVLVGGIAYSTMDQTNVISSDAEIGFLVLFMGITYIGATIVGRIRYQ